MNVPRPTITRKIYGKCYLAAAVLNLLQDFRISLLWYLYYKIYK